MSKRSQRVAPFYDAAQFANSEEIDFHVWFFPRLSDAIEATHIRSPFAASRDKSIIGFDFAVTLSSPESFCVLFDITSEQYVELKWLNVEQTQKMIPFIICEVSLGQYVCELVFGVNVFDLNLGVQIDSIEQPIKSNSVGSGNMSHCRTSPLEDHLDHCFVVFKDVQHSFLTRRIRV